MPADRGLISASLTRPSSRAASLKAPSSLARRVPPKAEKPPFFPTPDGFQPGYLI